MTVSRPQTLEEEVTRLRARIAELEQAATEHTRLERALQESRELFQVFLSNIPAFAWIKDAEGKYVYANRKMQTFLQKRGLSWYGMTDLDLWPPETAARIRHSDLIAAGSEGPCRSVESISDRDGEVVWQTCRFRFQSKAGKSYVAAIAEDVTEKNRLEIQARVAQSAEETSRAYALTILDSLRRSEMRVNRMFHSELTGILECEGTTIVDANDALLGWLGLTRNDLQDKPLDWREITAPRFHKADEECLQQLRGNGVCRAFEKELLARDGHTLPVLASAATLDRERGSFLVFFLNLSDRKEVGARLLRSQKLESLGLIAGGVAHDFNNLLATIMGNASLSLDALTPEHPAYYPLSEVLVGSRRASDLTQQVLAYSGRANFAIRSIDLSTAVKEIGSLLETTISKKLKLSFQLAENLPPMEGDEGQIQQVIMNLVINASDAIGENPGEIAVRTYTQDMGNEEFVCFEVRDTGCGMDEATQKRIFDPFFTTKANGRGLGLAAVMNVMKNHGGSLAVESVPGRGTTFRASFPASKTPKPMAPENRFKELGGTETILVVDDDEGIRRMTKASLERYGYKVLLAADGANAVEVFKANRGAISLVLLDWAMPVMNGEEALARLHQIDPNAKVLLSSGYAETDTVRRIGADSLAGFLQKPYTTTLLAERIREILAVGKQIQ